MLRFSRKQVEIAATIASKILGGTVCLSMIANQLPVLALGSIASSRVQQNAGLSECNTSAITALINRLSEPGSLSAFNSLVQCGEPATQPLISVINDARKDSWTRRLAARALGQIGSPEAIAALIAIAQHQSEIHDSALRAIADINPQAREAVSVLLTAAINQNAAIMNARANALQRIDPSAPVRAIVTAFWEATLIPNTHRHRTSTALLDQLRTSESSLADLTQALQDSDAVIRAIAAYLLLQEGRNAQTAIPQLTTALTDDSSLVRDTAACALGRIGTREAITVLITQLKTGNEATQASAAVGLSSLTAEAREALPVLIAALRDDNEQVRSMAAYALGQLGRDARRAIPALLGRLNDPSASIRATAAYALGQIAPDDPRVIRLIIRQAEADTDSQVQSIAAESLRQMTPEAIPTLFEIFASRNSQEAETAAYLLLQFGSAVDASLTHDELPLILQGISFIPRYQVSVRSDRIQFAEYFLQQLNTEIVSTLITSLQDQNEDIRIGAMRSLAFSSQYFNRQAIEAAIPILREEFFRSQIYSLWQSDNRQLIAVEVATTPQEYDAAFSGVENLVLGDRLGLAALDGLFALRDWQFYDSLDRENQAAFELVEDIAFTVVVPGGTQLATAVRTHPISRTPAICRLPIARFLWRCR